MGPKSASASVEHAAAKSKVGARRRVAHPWFASSPAGCALHVSSARRQRLRAASFARSSSVEDVSQVADIRGGRPSTAAGSAFGPGCRCGRPHAVLTFLCQVVNTWAACFSDA